MFNIREILLGVWDESARSVGIGTANAATDGHDGTAYVSWSGLGIIAAAVAGIVWSIWHMPAARPPDSLSCSANGSPFNVRRLDRSAANPDLSLHAAYLGQVSRETDFCVFRNGRSIGRIRIAQGTPLNPDWQWTINVPLPVPPWGHGSTKSLPEAKEAFAKSWGRFFSGLTPDDITRWDQMPDTMVKR